jgi:hypothetical protein
MRGTLRDQFRGKHPFFWVVVIAAVYGVIAFALNLVMLYKYAGLEKDGYIWDTDLRIGVVIPKGPADGKLQVGDVIRTINGNPATVDGLLQNYSQPIGTDYTLEIERNGLRQQVALKLVVHETPYTPAQRQSQISGVFVSLGLLLVALLVGLLRPADPTVRLLFASFYLGALTGMLDQLGGSTMELRR